MEYNIECSSDNNFINYELTPYVSEYKLIIFCEREDGELFTLIDKTGQCPHGIVTDSIKTLCVQNVKELTDIELSEQQIKYWYFTNDNSIQFYYVACIQGNVDERWLHISELKDIPILTEDYELIKKLYKYVTKQELV